MLTLDDIDAIRAQRQRAALLYLTDRCPVGCAHCSVSALPRGARPADAGLLERLVDGICAAASISLVGISGGEPFTERRALQEATGRLSAAGKRLVLYTSGNWGRDDGTAPPWTREVLIRAATVVLSTDPYHAARVPSARYVAALTAAAAAGSWVAVQAIGPAAPAERLLTSAFGTCWRERAEIRVTPLLRRGRATSSMPAPGVAAAAMRPGRDYGPCRLASAPVIRHDGRLTACCDENVVTGHGPAHLHATARTAADLTRRLADLRNDPYLAAIAVAGPGELTRLPRYRQIGDAHHDDICSACWALLHAGAGQDPAVHAIGLAALNRATVNRATVNKATVNRAEQ
jgi:hypothetical protein